MKICNSNKKYCIFYVNMEIIIITKHPCKKLLLFLFAGRFYRMVSAFFLFVIFSKLQGILDS